jgi:hAT family C-terminal dimerisation region
LPVSSATCERNFSALKLIQTHLRSTVCDSRLSNGDVLSVEHVRALAINLDDFVEEFDARHYNRKLALLESLLFKSTSVFVFCSYSLM